ncbi:cathepsin L1 isoform X2 [Chelonus insularis]|nr:cathepsin L1 isoform X2 [Chelonus insularis]XP_034942403.1 cathepsin L1 isoform X2 [Chelonus insularis]XP_034942404.1 cathepsin L1 isoform X2 [Chelonus insularis]
MSERMDECWYTYKTRLNKTYTTKEELERRAAWEKNLLKIYEHNLMAEAGHHTYTLKDNHIADLCTYQYMKNMVKLKPSRRRKINDNEIVGAVLHDPTRIPTNLDWRKRGFNTIAIDQRACGSCYAYSIVESLMGQIFQKTGRMIPLSAQQLIDCSTVTGNLGCSGGSLRNTLKYIEKAGGLMEERNYPYVAEEGRCKFQRILSIINITSWAILPARDERALQAAVATIGPIAVSINASPRTFQLYHQGIYDDPLCSSDTVNHAMLLVGYTPQEWILKNWWGENWGEGGYMRIRRNKNLCGIANYAAYARI